MHMVAAKEPAVKYQARIQVLHCAQPRRTGADSHRLTQKNMQRFFSSNLIAGLIVVLLPLSSPAQTHVTVQIDGSNTHQVMDGFGIQLYALGGFVNFHGVQYSEFVPDMVNRFNYRYARIIIDPQNKESINDNASPANYNWGYFNPVFAASKDRWGVSIFERFKLMQDYGLEPIPTPNFWPVWMLTSNSDPANRIRYFDGSIPNIYQEVGEFWAAFCIYARNNHNLVFKLISMQNEPDTAGHTAFSAEEIRLATIATGDRLRSEGFTTEFVSPDTGKASLTSNYADATFNSDPYLNYTKTVSYHAYDNGSLNSTDIFNVANLGNLSLTNMFNNASISQSNKPLWMLEWVPNGVLTLINTHDYAIARAKHVHNNFTLANAAAYFIWNIGGNDTDIFTGKTGSTINYRPYTYACGQYSKYIPAGSKRLNCMTSGTGQVSVSAFADTNQFTAVLINEDLLSRTVRLDLNNLPPVKSVTQIETSLTRKMDTVGTLTPTNNRIVATLPGRSVTTLVGSLSANPASVDGWKGYR